MSTQSTNRRRFFSLSPRLLFALASFGALTVACSDGRDEDRATALATATDTDASTPNAEGASCTSSSRSCTDGVLTSCEEGTTRTLSCQEQCEADGFEPGSKCSTDGTRCGCGDATDVVCLNAVEAACTCLDTIAACQGVGILDTYVRCHRDPTSETATLVKCFSKYKSGAEVACNTAIMQCGDAVPSNKCTANVDCGRCERCELSTGKCLTRVDCK